MVHQPSTLLAGQSAQEATLLHHLQPGYQTSNMTVKWLLIELNV